MNDGCYSGESRDLVAHGKGTYDLRSGAKYEGQHFEGMFDGDGTLTFASGSKVIGQWKKGRLVNGTLYFADGLEFKRGDWKYCTDADRRFWTEIQTSIKLSDEPQLTNKLIPHRIPLGSSDVGDGYMHPADGIIRSYEGVKLRVPEDTEAEWAKSKCRVGRDDLSAPR